MDVKNLYVGMFGSKRCEMVMGWDRVANTTQEFDLEPPDTVVISEETPRICETRWRLRYVGSKVPYSRTLMCWHVASYSLSLA